MYNNFTVRINSALADLAVHAKRDDKGNLETHGHSASLLYSFLRGIDAKVDEEGNVIQGACGKVVFNISDAASCLDRTASTIKDYLVDGVRLGFFRSYKRIGNTVTVYYASLHSIAARYELESLGVFADIPLTELKHLKYWGTQLAAQHLQGASRHLAKKKLSRHEQVLQPEDILNSPTNIKGYPKSKSPNAAKPIKKQDRVSVSEQEAVQWARNVVYRSLRYTFVDSHFIMFGVSQERIAEYQGRSVSTVHRRLNNNTRHWIGSDARGTRRERGIDPLPTTQLAQFKMGGMSRSTFNERKALEVDLKQEFWASGGVWKASTNLYERQFQIRSGKACRYWYKKYLESGKFSHLTNTSSTSTSTSPNTPNTEQPKQP